MLKNITFVTELKHLCKNFLIRTVVSHTGDWRVATLAPNIKFHFISSFQ